MEIKPILRNEDINKTNWDMASEHLLSVIRDLVDIDASSVNIISKSDGEIVIKIKIQDQDTMMYFFQKGIQDGRTVLIYDNTFFSTIDKIENFIIDDLIMNKSRPIEYM